MNQSLISFLLVGMLSLPIFCTGQDSDRDEDQLVKTYLDYGAKAIGTTGDFKAFVVGSAITVEMIEDEAISKELSRINELADVIIVGLESLREPIEKLTGLEVYVSEQYFDEVETEIGSAKYWVLISKKDNDLSRFVSAKDLTRMLTSTKKVESRNVNKPEEDDEKFFRAEAVYELIGSKRDANLLFVGNDVPKDSVVNSPVPNLWKELDVKVDFVIVFSEEMKAAVSKVSSSKVLLAKGDYSDYFVKTWKSMMQWFLIEFKDGDGGSLVATNEAYDLIEEF